jgi:hypothetical protein
MLEFDPRFDKYRTNAMVWLETIHPSVWVDQPPPQDLLYGILPSFASMFSSLSGQLQCSNPHNKIFGTMGIIAEFHDLDNSEFPINYNVDSKVTLMRVIKGVRYKRRNVNLLFIGYIKDIGAGGL